MSLVLFEISPSMHGNKAQGHAACEVIISYSRIYMRINGMDLWELHPPHELSVVRATLRHVHDYRVRSWSGCDPRDTSTDGLRDPVDRRSRAMPGTPFPSTSPSNADDRSGKDYARSARTYLNDMERGAAMPLQAAVQAFGEISARPAT